MSPVRTCVAVLVAVASLAGCTGGSGKSEGSSAPVSARPSGTGTAAPTGGTTAASGEATREDTKSVPVPQKPIRVITIQGAHDTYVIRIWAELTATTCSPYASGTKIVAYLRTHPCAKLDRYLATTTVDKKQVGLSVATLTFPGTTAAAGFGALATDARAGSIEDLFRTGRRLPDGPQQLPVSRTNGARSDGTRAITVDAWYLPARKSAGDPALTELIESLSP